MQSKLQQIAVPKLHLSESIQVPDDRSILTLRKTNQESITQMQSPKIQVKNPLAFTYTLLKVQKRHRLKHPKQHREYEQAKAHALKEYVKFVATYSIPRAISLEDVQRATKQDTDLQKVLKALTKDDNTLWNALKGYKNIKHETTYENEVVLRNNKIVFQ
ncbi:hypothetical protein QE152_g26773 [Popillia japonica]|uniref:Uncharacterized protein n=1 Tax=Popillia japonica TaxID=7064 RepID=A0AAW1JWU1_POPJA